MASDLKHTMKLVTKWIKKRTVLKFWVDHQENLSPSENLWEKLKSKTAYKFDTCQEEQAIIPVHYHEKLVEGTPQHMN